VLDAAVFGNSIHAVVADSAAAVPALRDLLASREVKVARIEPIPASLEDVFVSLTSERARTEAA